MQAVSIIAPLDLFFGVSGIWKAILFIPILTTGLTILLPIFTVQVWRKNYWSLTGRLHYSLVTLAAIAFIPFLIYWNLLGFQY
jgi:hypothetical protein